MVRMDLRPGTVGFQPHPIATAAGDLVALDGD